MNATEARFDAAYGAHSCLVFNFLRRFLGDADDAEDAAVETFRRVHAGLGGFRGECSERSWVMRIAVSVAIRAKEQSKRRLTTSLDGMTESSAWEPIEAGRMESSALNKAHAEWLLSQLPERQRAAVWLRVALEYSDSEVAEILGVPIGTVKAWVWRSLARLRKTCAEDPSECEVRHG